MKKAMKAAILRGAKQIEIADVNKPSPAEGEILLRVGAVGICGTDLHTYNGTSASTAPTNLIMGHEFSGTIEEIGAGVTGFTLGQKVVGEHVISCGQCAFCRPGNPNLCKESSVIGIDQPGALAEFITIPASLVYAVPQEMDLETAALIEPLAIAVYVVREAPSLLDATVAVIGQGPIGLLIARVCKLAGAKVIGIDVMDARLKFAQEKGFVDHVINSTNKSNEQIAAEITHITGDQDVDAAFEAVGRQETVDLSIDITRKSGSIFLVGLFKGSEKIHIEKVVKKELKIRGSYTCSFSFPAAIDLAASGKVDLAALITHRYPLELAAQAFADAASYAQDRIKTVITVK